MSKVTGAEIGIDNKHSNEQWFENMIKSFITSKGTMYVERALNTIKVQKQHLNLIVITVKPRSDLSLNHYIVRNRDNYIERTESALCELLEFKKHDEEDKFFDYLFPNGSVGKNNCFYDPNHDYSYLASLWT